MKTYLSFYVILYRHVMCVWWIRAGCMPTVYAQMDQHGSMLNLCINRLWTIQSTNGGEEFRETSASHSVGPTLHHQPWHYFPHHNTATRRFSPHIEIKSSCTQSRQIKIPSGSLLLICKWKSTLCSFPLCKSYSLSHCDKLLTEFKYQQLRPLCF